MKKRILITNDDGYKSAGLKALVDTLSPLAQVCVVAPSSEKSACSHSLTLNRPLRFEKIDDDFFALVDATPSDCVYLALHALYEEDKMPDLVLSGINLGANLGEDITYSGTAGASMEAVLQGIPSVAFSQVFSSGDISADIFDFSLAKEFAFDLTKKILEGNFPLGKRKFHDWINSRISYRR